LPDRDYYFKSDASTIAILNHTKNTLPHYFSKRVAILKGKKNNAALVLI
jgi:hypothetical protein